MDSSSGDNSLSSHEDMPSENSYEVTAGLEEQHQMDSFSSDGSIDTSSHGDTTDESDYGSDAIEAWAAHEYAVEHVCTAPSHFSQLLGQLDDFRSSSLFCDVELVAEDGTSIKAHRAVLAAASPYFRDVFSGGHSEEKQYQVEIGGVSSVVLKMLVDSVYTGQLKLSQANVKEIITAASMLQLSAAETICTKFMCDNLHECNALDAHRFACDGNFTFLAKYSFRYIHKYLEFVSKSKKFLDLSLEEMARHLSSDNVSVDESAVLKAAIRWIEKSPEERRIHLNDVLKHIQISLIPSVTLMESVRLCDDAILKGMMNSVFNDIIKGRSRECEMSIASSLTAKQNGNKTVIYIVGGWVPIGKRRSDLNHNVMYFDTCSREWFDPPGIYRNMLCSVLHKVHALPVIATLGCDIYLVGGTTADDEISTSGYAFHTHKTGCWQMHGTLQVVRSDFGLCELDGYLYAFGGYNATGIMGSVEKYDPQADKWHLIDDMPKALCATSVVSHGGLLYLIGGIREDDTFSQDFMSYDPETKEWKQLSPWVNPRRYMGVAVLGGHLYVVGGSGHRYLNYPSDTVDRYSFEHDKWSKVAPLKWAVAQAGVAAANDRLYVMGGQVAGTDGSSGVIVSDMIYYQPETDTWSKTISMPLPRSQFVALAL